MSFRRILIAVDGDPLAAHAAEIAFVHAIDPGLSQATGITPADLMAEAKREGRRLIAGCCQHLPRPHAPL